MLASLLLAAIAPPASAVTLGTTTALNTGEMSHVFQPAIGAAGSKIHAVFGAAAGPEWQVHYRRSVDGGLTWKPAIELSRPTAALSWYPSISVSGVRVDVVWAEITDLATGAGAIFHRYSVNGGAAWSSPKRLTATTTANVVPAVVRSVGSTVIITYTDGETGKVFIRRSMDGGVTWLVRQQIGTTTRQPYLESATFSADTRLAAGTKLFAAFFSGPTTIVVRTSSDVGATWTAAKTIDADSGGATMDITASGAKAIVTYGWFDGTTHEKAAIRQTSDNGVTWAPRRFLTNGSFPASGTAVIRAGGKWRMLFEQCQDASCVKPLVVWYRDSVDGVTWSGAARLSQLSRISFAGGLAYTSSNATTWVIWIGFTSLESLGGNVYVRGIT